jgi:hypothetical protein
MTGHGYLELRFVSLMNWRLKSSKGAHPYIKHRTGHGRVGGGALGMSVTVI